MSRFLFLVLVCFASLPAHSAGSFGVPACLDSDRSLLPVNNEEVLVWKEESPNQYKDRALIDGVLVGVLLERKSHLHLEVDLIPKNGPRQRVEHLEIVYNKEFGPVGNLRPGARVVACGDYITAREQSGPYKPSPVGAILHWVHATNNPAKHPGGFLSIGDEVYGLGAQRLAPWALFPAFE